MYIVHRTLTNWLPCVTLISNKFKCNNFSTLIDEQVCAARYQLAAFYPISFLTGARPHAKCQMLPNEDWFWSVSPFLPFYLTSIPPQPLLPSFLFLLLVVCLNVCRESKCVGKSDDSVNCTAAGGRGLSYQLTHLPISDPFSNKSAQESATIFYPFCHRLCQFPVVLCWNSLPEVWKQIICCNFCIIRFYFFASVLWKKNQTKYLATSWFVTLYQTEVSE